MARALFPRALAMIIAIGHLSNEKVWVVEKERAMKGTVYLAWRRLWKGQMRDSMPHTLQFIPSKRQSDIHSWTVHGIMCGRLRVLNERLLPATGATLTDSGGLAHWSAMHINLWRRWMGAPMTPLFDDARRKHATHNLPSDIFLKKSMTRSSWCRKCEAS
jgi:hypothetical protein